MYIDYLVILLKGRFSEWDYILSSKEVNEFSKGIYKIVLVMVVFISKSRKISLLDLSFSIVRNVLVNT